VESLVPSTKPRNEEERLERLLDGVGVYLLTAPGEELLEDAREEGQNSAETTARVTGLLKTAFNKALTRKGPNGV